MPTDEIKRARRGVVAVIVRDKRFLVVERSQQVEAPGAFCFPGGGIEKGESEEVALRRELMEELSLEVNPVRRIWRSVTSWNVELAWWQATADSLSSLSANFDEVASVHWLTMREMREMPALLESNHSFLDAVERKKVVISAC